MEFKDLKVLVQQQFDVMSKHELFVTNVDKDKMWETYLSSFKEGTNPIHKERTEHDCQGCKSFIRNAANVVAIIDNKLVSIWDIKIDNDYQVVVDALSKLVKNAPINAVFLHFEENLGTDFNHQLLENDTTKRWEHFHYKLPSRFVNKTDIGTVLSNKRSTKQVFKRSLDEISIYSLETVLELIDQNSVYRGAEFRGAVESFLILKNKYDKVPEKSRDNWLWLKTAANKAFGIKNTVIGTLLIDVADGIELDEAVHKFGHKMDGYKRPDKPIVSKKQVDSANKAAIEQGFVDSLPRRHANVDDITINNVRFANRTAKTAMNVFDEIKKDIPENLKKLDKVEEVSIETFMNDILPKSSTIELMVENKHTSNLFSLISPVNKDSKNILKWDNNFTWTYNGEVADSLRKRVKEAGGRVDGVFRFSHSWNEIEPNQSLMDLHVFMPGHKHTDQKVHNSYGNSERVGWNNRHHSKSGGSQDVDYTSQAPKGYVPVENITFPYLKNMPNGEYICKIHNWDFRNSGGKGNAEIEFGGNVYKYVYPETKHKEWITVAKVLKDGSDFSIKHLLPESNESKKVWNVSTNKFQNVSMIMNSPNHWDDNETGNKHYFFVLEDCLNPESTRGFFNEQLNENLKEHRKVFEILGSKMRVEKSDDQLSGLGFSSTQKNSCLCKVTGSFTRIIKINF